MDALVRLLKEQGYLKATRSAVVRMALFELQDALAGRARDDIVKYVVQRDAARLVATLDETTARLPST